MKLFGWWSKQSVPTAPEEQAEETPFPDPVVLEITDVFDLHSMPPKQTKAVIKEYLREAHARGFRYVRVIHGKGIGVQREITRQVLANTPFVLHFSDAPPAAGGWGATVVELQSGKATNCENGDESA